MGIGDDQSIGGDELEQLVDEAFEGGSYAYSYQSFSSGNALLQHLEHDPGSFQIYLLDIEMEGLNGLETAQQIRRQDRDAVIIFITSHGELMPNAVRVLAFAYLVKPLDKQAVIETLHAAVQSLEQRKALYLYSIRKKVYSVSLVHIEYIESLGRKIIIHMLDGTQVEYNGSLKEAMGKVEGAPFARAHNSYVVNLEQIAMLESGRMVLRSGAEIGIGSRYHAAFHAAYREHILAHII